MIVQSVFTRSGRCPNIQLFQSSSFQNLPKKSPSQDVFSIRFGAEKPTEPENWDEVKGLFINQFGIFEEYYQHLNQTENLDTIKQLSENYKKTNDEIFEKLANASQNLSEDHLSFYEGVKHTMSNTINAAVRLGVIIDYKRHKYNEESPFTLAQLHEAQEAINFYRDFLNDPSNKKFSHINSIFNFVIKQLTPKAKAKNVSIKIFVSSKRVKSNTDLDLLNVKFIDRLYPADVYHLFQVITDNAIKYSYHGRNVAINFIPEYADEAKTQMKGLWFEVKDRGRGIDQSELDHVGVEAGRTQSAKRSKVGGTGQGLHNVYKAHLDKTKKPITIQSKGIGKGTLVTAYIPLQIKGTKF